MNEYNERNAEIEVSFRDLVPNLNKNDRYTHLIHPYPAKLIAHIPFFFLNNDIFSKKGDIILDPFAGSGTVLLESLISERNSIGSDSNPLARLISKVKTTRLSPNLLLENLAFIEREFSFQNQEFVPKLKNIDYWFSPNVKKQLGRLFSTIQKINHDQHREFFLICFSNCIKKVSYADSRVSVPVKINLERHKPNSRLYIEVSQKIKNLESINIYEKFKEVCLANIKRINSLEHLSSLTTSAIVSKDARKITRSLEDNELIDDNSIDLIITSPPYAGAQKYIRSSSLNLAWLNEIEDNNSLKLLDSKNIGRENYKKIEYCTLKKTGIEKADDLLEKIFRTNPTRSFIAANYLLEMRDVFTEMHRVLKHGKYFILVIGNNNVCGYEFNTQLYLTEMLESLGFKVVLKLIDDIKSFGLMTKRNKTADLISREWIIVLQKK
ncbi:hypothetical protein I6I98_13010 [Sphingobacterium multivorum]|uniref:site-specific DNA-methyltransferase (cytosine-N(4)-specific) n=1 Tax=Sphingobacterium multivorum TaxID=28454 RepID=A0ABX7D0D2_SPHMU|nr:DNA methyltransferase [Sphingobacterium multivorum]QQT56122.1 hypothetical protein I6I98_13010 [Sphingobacterium multivorum]